jgi:hypothetical protein
MEAYKSAFQTIRVYEDLKLLAKEWTTDTEYMSEQKFKEEVEKIAEVAEKYKVEKFHDNTTNFLFPISPELQTWVNESIFTRFIAAGLKKYALIVSKEMIAQLSIEQTMEEDNASNFQVKYFDSPEKASEWLQS